MRKLAHWLSESITEKAVTLQNITVIEYMIKTKTMYKIQITSGKKINNIKTIYYVYISIRIFNKDKQNKVAFSQTLSSLNGSQQQKNT